MAFDLGTRQTVWRVKVDGFRSDHMALSPDGARLLVSASTAAKVHVIDTRRGAIVAEFASGDQPHENAYSADGSRIFHASIGLVCTPLDASSLDPLKGRATCRSSTRRRCRASSTSWTPRITASR